MSRSVITVVLLTLLAACGKTAPVPPEVAAAAHKAVDVEYELKGPREFTGTWYGMADPTSGMVCGTFMPQPIEKPYGTERRYIFDQKGGLLLDPIPELQITLSPVTQSIIGENDRLFDQAWGTACEKFRPGPFKKSV